MTDNLTAVLHGIDDLRLESRAVPQPAADEVLVEIRAVGVCGSDVHYWTHGRIGDFVVRDPLVLGHESAGVVAARGSAVDHLEVSQRVAIEPGVPCRTCRICLAGRYNLCEDMRFHATPPVDGTFTRYQTVHADFAFALPDHLSDEAGAMIEPWAVGLWCTQKASVSPGDHVLVTGAGPVGLLALQAARLRGASQVTVTDVNPARLERASQLGATTAADAREVDLGQTAADVLLECSGAAGVLGAALRGLRPAGRAVAVGMGGDEVTLPLSVLQTREVWLTGTFRYANTYAAAIEAAAAGRVVLDDLVTHRLPLDQAEEALRLTHQDPSALKVMVLPQAG